MIGSIAMLVGAPVAFLYALSVCHDAPDRSVARIVAGVSAVEFVVVTLLVLSVAVANLGLEW